MAATKACPTCSDRKGLCGGPNRMKNFFVLTLQDGFEERTVIPCYTRAYFLQKYAVARCQKTSFMAALVTKEGFSFGVNVTNNTGITYISGRIWKEFARIYSLEAGQELYLSIGTHGTETGVTTEKLPITHPVYYHMSRKGREIVDSLSSTDGTKINWKMMETVIYHVHSLDYVVDYHGGGDYEAGSTVPMMHTLNWTNCCSHKKHLKIPQRFIPDDMDKYGDITIVSHPYNKVKGKYTISETDGRLCISTAWKEFMQKEQSLKIGDKMLFLMYLGENGAYLFVDSVPDVVLD